MGEFYLEKARRKRSTQPIRMLSECRAYYSQEYRLNMLRQALRKAMSDMDMGVTQYWALIDADGSGFLDREEFEGVMSLSGVLSSQMEIDTCIEQFNVGPEEITQDVYYDWLLSTDTARMNQPRRRSKGDDHRDVLLLQREAESALQTHEQWARSPHAAWIQELSAELDSEGRVALLAKQRLREFLLSADELEKTSELLQHDINLLSSVWVISLADIECHELVARTNTCEVFRATYRHHWEVAVKKIANEKGKEVNPL